MSPPATPPTTPPTPPPKAPRPRKRSLGLRLALRLGPSALVGLAVAWLLRDVGKAPAWQIGLVAGILFFFAWQALSLRMRRAGRSAAHSLKSFTLAVLFLAAAVALAWFFWLR